MPSLRGRIAGAALLLAALLPAAASAAEATHVRVGLVAAPPYAVESDGGVWLGYAVESWRIMAEKNGWSYAFTPLDPAAAARALAEGRVDAVLPVIATADLARDGALTLPLSTATMGIAVSRETVVMTVLGALISPVFLQLCAGISVLLFVVGALVWLVERKRNGRQFSPHPLKGVGDGFWFAGVTLTTIGYGDKTPVTFAGRVIAMIWMLAGVIVTSALTATIVTLAGSAVESDGTFRAGPVGVVAGSATAAYLAAEGRHVRTYPTLPAAVAAFEAGEIDQVADLAPALRAAVADIPFPLAVRDTDSNPLQITIALPRGSPLLEPLNVAILDLNASDGSRRLRAEYLKGE